MLPLVLLTCVLLAWADPPPQPARPPADSPHAVVEALETALGEAIAKAELSVVAIARERSEEGDETIAVRGRARDVNFRDPRLGMGRAGLLTPNWVSFDYGSGVVIGDRGEILTTFHVVKGAARLVVRAAERQSFEAEILAADPRSDLAVIAPRELPGLAPPKLKPIALGDSTRLRKGSFLMALGNPFNAAWDGRPAASWGILANVARRLLPSEDDQMKRAVQLRHYPTLLQLDAKLNLGMSGGAVINLKGELVGVTTAAASAAGFDAQAGYAIPMDAMGRRAVELLKQGREVEYGFLGIGLDEQGTNKVASAQSGTPADQAGLLMDDVIVAVNDTPVTDSESLMLAINTLPAGATVRLKILRRGEPLEKSVELAKYHVAGEVIATNRPTAWRGLRVDYMSMFPSTPFGFDLQSAMARGGVRVVEVEPGSPAAKVGLKRDQVITHVGDQRVRSPREFARAVKGLGGPVKLQTDLGAVTLK